MLNVTFALACAVSAPDSATPYEVDFVGDGIVTGASLALLSVWYAGVAPQLLGERRCRKLPGTGRCDPASLSALDRSVVDNDSDTWELVGEIGQIGTLVMAGGGVFLDAFLAETDSPATDAFTDLLVIMEAVALATVFNESLGYAVSRPRPWAYRDTATTGRIDPRASFPSGHTMAAASAASAYATTYWLRHPNSWTRFLIVGAGGVATTLTALGRTGSGSHFYTDVIAGAVVGVAFGVGVPLLHRREMSLGAAPLVDGSGRRGLQLSLSGTF